MHITLDTKELQSKLELVGRVSTKHVTLPVLQCVLISVQKGVVTLKATNLEVGIEASLPAKVEEEGVIAVPASVLIQTINYNTNREVTLQTEDTTLVVEGGGSRTQIKSIPHDEFPTILRLDGSGQSVQRELFSLGVKSAVFAASLSSIKPELGSVYIFQKKEHSLTFVATDSFRLMEKTVPQKNITLDSSLLIPAKNATEITRILDLMNDDPLMRFTENQCSFEFSDGLYVTTRLTTGSFPDYAQIIPKEYVTHSTVLRSDLMQILKKTNIFLNKFSQVSLHVTDRSITISANNGELGTTTESLAAETDGDDLTLSFNQRYVSEVLGHLVDDSIVLHFAGIGRPMVIEGVNDKSVRYLVMPMNK
ncbi:DNA polymerase III subunit beta [Candidatus Nomurabacteria bacterium]|nr:DNA polymerase III subunit beta [Candidatus Nomurabacteria bacterium]